MQDFEDQNISGEQEFEKEPVIELLEEEDQGVNMLPEDPIPPQETVYRGRGTGRRESPYADSPYVMHHQPERENYHMPRTEFTYTPPEEPVPEEPFGKAPRVRKKKKNGFWKKFVVSAAALALVGGSCSATAYLVNQHWEERTEAMEASFNQQLNELKSQMDAAIGEQNQNKPVSGSLLHTSSTTAGQVYADNVDSVVLIESTVVSSYYGQTATGKSSGSGFILTEDGYVVTNYHVIEGASAVSVVLYDGTKYPATVVGYDNTNDVAVLKVEATGLNPVTLGSSSALDVGDQVVAIGNPLGELTSTLTVGYVSAKERSITTDGTIINMIQTDAAINSGNSGGPLFNMKGEVVGITTAKYSGSSSSGASIEGIGFAIPVDDVTEIFEELIEFGYVKSAYMGVVVQNMDSDTANMYGLPVGAYVVSVEEGYAAHRAGIQAKDIIIAINDQSVENLTDLTRILRDYEPGDEVDVTIYRGGAEKTLKMTLDERPADLDVVQDSNTQPQMPEGNYDDWYDYFFPFSGNGGQNGNQNGG